MVSTESRSRWVLSLIRAGGISVMFFIALTGSPGSLCAEGDRIDYRTGCMSDGDLCVSIEETCGEAAGEECTDEGETYCDAGVLWSCPGNMPYALVCGFDHGGGGGPN